jgi:tetratricopeptide (TPR) repeat protein
MLTNLWQEAQLSGDSSRRELRESLLQTMLQYYNEVPLEQSDADPEMRLTKALVKFYAAHVHHYLGEYQQAEAQFKVALPALKDLATARPDHLAYRRWWALCCYRLGVTLILKNELEQARQWLREALDILNTSSGDLSLGSLEARCRIDLARLVDTPKETSEAISQAERAATLWRSILSVDTDNDEHRWNLCNTLNFLTRLAIRNGNIDQAAAFIAECSSTSDTWDGSAGSFYEVSSCTDLADSYRVLGHATSDESRYEQALAHFDAALKLLERVQKQRLDYAQARSIAHGVYWSRAVTYELMGLPHESLLDWDRCVEVSDGSLRDVAWIRRAKFRLDMGDFQQAAADADELFAARELSPENLFELAVVYCRCADAAESNESLELEKAHSDRDELHARAVKCLARCHAAGFFSDPARRHDLETMPILSVLHSRPDFGKLLEDVAVTEQ